MFKKKDMDDDDSTLSETALKMYVNLRYKKAAVVLKFLNREI